MSKFSIDSKTISPSSYADFRSYIKNLPAHLAISICNENNMWEALSEVIESTVKLGDVNFRNAGGLTSLMVLAQNEFSPAILKIIETLLNAGANINAVDDFGNTALQYALDNNNKKMASYLYSKGAEIATPTDLLQEAAEQNNFDKVLYLLNSGANASQVKISKTPNPCTALLQNITALGTKLGGDIYRASRIANSKNQTDDIIFAIKSFAYFNQEYLPNLNQDHLPFVLNSLPQDIISRLMRVFNFKDTTPIADQLLQIISSYTQLEVAEELKREHGHKDHQRQSDTKLQPSVPTPKVSEPAKVSESLDFSKLSLWEILELCNQDKTKWDKGNEAIKNLAFSHELVLENENGLTPLMFVAQIKVS
jgi:ankyrin repeat protein